MAPSFEKEIESVKSNWYLWLFPLFAILITAYLFVEFYHQRGPTIRIYFEEASGIEPDKTEIRFRGVQIGTVKKVYLSPENENVVVEATLHRDAQQFAVEGTRFWTVIPNVNLRGITGLETLIEGTYIASQPGSDPSKGKSDFKGQVGAGPTTEIEGTSTYFLEANNVESINPGDAISYRGLRIGSVTKLTLTKDSQTILIQINIENRYVKLIRNNTFFWRKSGIQAKLGLFNSEIKINSFDTILHSGIEVATPDNPAPMAQANSQFLLFAAPPKDWEKWNPKLEYE